MTALGRHDGEPLIVDLRQLPIETWPQLWDALTDPCGLPSWFGRNLNAWWDTIQVGAISEVLDEHHRLIVRVSPTGLFSPGAEGQAFLDVTNQCDHAQAETSPQ